MTRSTGSTSSSTNVSAQSSTCWYSGSVSKPHVIDEPLSENESDGAALPGGTAAVDGKHGAGRVARRRASQIQRSTDDLMRFARTAQRVLGEPLAHSVHVPVLADIG